MSQLFKNDVDKDIAVLVMSCDKYADLWKPYFDSFFHHWGQSSWQIYLAANELKFEDSRVVSLLSGPDKDWTSSIRSVLQQIVQKRVLILVEDAFFVDDINQEKLKILSNWSAEHNCPYLRLSASPKPTERSDFPLIGRISESTAYRTALHGVIWSKAFLNSIMEDGESAWKFEINSPARSKKEKNIMSTWTSYLPVVHGVEKGIWLPDALRLLRRRGYITGEVVRPVLSDGNFFVRKFTVQAKHLARRALPEYLRVKLSNFIWRNQA